MYSSHSFTKVSRQSISSKERPFTSNRLSHDSNYHTQNSSKGVLIEDSDLQCYLPGSISCSSFNPLSKTTSLYQKNKKTVKTIKLKSYLKSESNENDINEHKQSKINTRIHTDNSCQSSEKPFRKFRLADNTMATPLQSSTLNLKNLRNLKPKVSNGTVTPSHNRISQNSSSNVTCRQSEIFSLSPIRDKIRLEVKLKKVEDLYESSVNNYKELLIKLSIEIEKNKLLDKQKSRLKDEKEIVESIAKQKQEVVKKKDEIIKQKQRSLLDTHKLVKQKQLIINAKNQQFSSIISEYEYRITSYEDSIVKYEQQLSKTKNQLSSASLKVEPFNSKLISCLDQIQYLKHQKDDLTKGHIEELYFKNKEILRLNHVVENLRNAGKIDNLAIGTSFETFGAQDYVQKDLSPNTHSNYPINFQNYQNFNTDPNESSYKSEYYEDLDEKVSVVIASKPKDITRTKNTNSNLNTEVKMFQPISYGAIKRNSLMDMKEVMSIDGAEETYRSRCM